jgi:POT family proton-dependent oligopeptide transporter
MLTLFRAQPRAFHVIFMLEIWERFGFYTAQGILTLYFIRFLGMSNSNAYYTFGAFSALVYGMVAIGGFLGDRILGTKRTIILGLVVLAAGYLALACATPSTVYYALGLVAVGNGVFKANPSNLLSRCYDTNDPRLHSGFTLYYMAINMGALFALMIGPTLSSHFGYSYAYFASFIGILLGLTNYWFQRQYIQPLQTPSDERFIPYWVWAAILCGIIIMTGLAAQLLHDVMLTKHILYGVVLLCLTFYLWCMHQETPAARTRMFVALILMIQAILFFTLYQQMPTSLTLFAVHHVRASLLGVPIDPQSFQALNPIWIILMGPGLVLLYSKFSQRSQPFPTPYKFALGMCFCGLSFSLLFFSRYAHDAHAMISPGWIIASYCFQSIAELLVSALGVAMVAELVPETIRGFVMGMWFLTSSVAGFSGAYVASLTGLSATTETSALLSLWAFTRVFGWIGICSLMIALLLWLIAPALSRMMRP